MRNILPALCILAACSTTGTPQVQIDPAKALYYLQAAGCIAQALAGVTAPVISATSDAKGNTVLAAASQSAATACSITVPAAAVAAK